MVKFRPDQCPRCVNREDIAGFKARLKVKPRQLSFAEDEKRFPGMNVSLVGVIDTRGRCMLPAMQVIGYGEKPERRMITRSHGFKGVTDKPCKHFKENG